MKEKISLNFCLLALTLLTASPIHSVVAKPILNDNDIKKMEALNLSSIENTEEQSSRTSQDLGAPIELSIVKSQKRYSDIFESENYDDKDELGNLVELQTGESKKEPSVYLSASMGFMSNKNILFSPVKPIEEGVFSTSVGVNAIPKIGKNLRLLIGINQGSIRYSKFRALSLDFKNISTGLIWEANPRTTLSLISFGTALYSFPANKEFFSDLGVIANVRHDIPINQDMQLSITAQSESHATTSGSNFSTTSSHYSHSIGTNLKAVLLPNLNADLGYRIRFDDYSYQRRNDVNNQVNLKLEYAVSPQIILSYIANYDFNRSSNRFSNYGAFSTGFELSTLMPLF
jgi:Putative beta-barrel porin 2